MKFLLAVLTPRRYHDRSSLRVYGLRHSGARVGHSLELSRCTATGYAAGVTPTQRVCGFRVGS
jgi:hypothetical protein